MSTLLARSAMQGAVIPAQNIQDTPAIGWKLSLVGVCFILTICFFAAQLLQDPKRFPVDHVNVLGTLDFANRAELKASVHNHTADGFYGLDIDQLRVEVERFAWVDRARVSRVWPSRITVEVEEHEPAARWNDQGLISKKLTVFSPPQLHPESESFREWQRVFEPLPLLSGSPGRQAALLDDFRLYEQQLSSIGLQLAQLSEDDRRSQTLESVSGVIVRLGYENHRLRMDRFIDVYLQLASDLAHEGSEKTALTFDMRYSNGFALGRKPPGIELDMGPDDD